MQLREYAPPLVHSRRGAITVVCLSGFLFALSIRASLLYVRHGGQPQFHWPFVLEVLPNWAVIVINLALYTYLLWLGVVLYRIARDGEKIVVLGWLADVLLGPIKIVLPPTGALAIRSLQTATMAVAFVAALFLVRKPYSKPAESDTRALKQRLLVFGVGIVIMLLVGALLYFVPRR